MMKHTFQEFPANSNFMQGDLITNNTKDITKKIFGMILNADCDIAQKKSGQHFSLVEIISALDYLNIIWSEIQCQTILESKQSLNLLYSINQYLQKKNSNFSALTQESFCEWLRDYSNCDDFFSAIGKKPSKDELNDLKIFTLASNINCANMIAGDRLREIWKIQNKKNTDESLKKALIKSEGFPDFFLLPELPNHEGAGFVILLRLVKSIPLEELFKNEIDVRIYGTPNSFYRFGRLADGIRFSAVQKMAFLFLRIGMHPYFEDECKASAELASELYSK